MNPVIKAETKWGEIVYATANDHTAWRVKTLFTKEPDTIEWMDSMNPGETFIDIGANIGLYSCYAAKRGLTVHAFEPEAQNYALLCRSIMINDIDAMAYCIALSDEFKVDALYLSAYMPGGSCHTFGADLNHRLESRDRPVGPLKQGCISMPFDQLGLKADHIKIDCDGLEHKIVAGAAKTIAKCKSVLVEINQRLTEHMNLVQYMHDIGFSHDDAQVKAATRTSGTFEGCGNWIFHR